MAYGDPAPVRFARACEPGEASTTIAAVGDVLLHTPLQSQATRLASLGRFRTLWTGVAQLLEQAGTTYANLEGPAARGLPLGSYPRFNYDPAVIDDLKASGVDVVSTANNHALDRDTEGVHRTIEKLAGAGLAFTGTRHKDDTNASWYTVTQQNGFTIAWLACTFSTNGIPDPHRVVLKCYEQTALLERIISNLSALPHVDAVIVTPHWGQEYQYTPQARERALAERFLGAGALAVLGAHPHVVQPYERFVVDGRERLVAFSLGNFVSGQEGVPRRTSMLLYLGLTRGREGDVWINGVRHVPLYMNRPTGLMSVEPLDRLPKAPAEALRLARDVLPRENEIGSSDTLVTNPECASK